MTYLQSILFACTVFALIYQTMKLIELHAVASRTRAWHLTRGWIPCVIFLPAAVYIAFIISLTGVWK